MAQINGEAEDTVTDSAAMGGAVWGRGAPSGATTSLSTSKCS